MPCVSDATVGNSMLFLVCQLFGEDNDEANEVEVKIMQKKIKNKSSNLNIRYDLHVP